MVFLSHNDPANKVKILDYTYTCEPSINTALPLKQSMIKSILFAIGCTLSVGFIWLMAKWSSKNKAILLYLVCDLSVATHFLIQEQDLKGGSSIIERHNKIDIKKREETIAFTYHQRTYLFYQQKESFLPIRYEELGIHLDKLRRNIFTPYTRAQRAQLNNYYGQNVIKLPVQTKLEVFFEQMLTPYEVFQTYAIILWIYEEYYIFSFLLLAYSLYTYWCNSRDISQNQRKLAEESYFQTQCKVITKELPFEHHNITHIADNPNSDQQMNDYQAKSMPNMKLNIIQFLSDEIEMPKFPTKFDNNDRHSPSSQNNLIMDVKMCSKKMSSHDIVPGDLIILREGDVVPCDCIIIKGEILVNQKYTTGETYLVRKSQLSDFTYVIEKEKSFMLYLGTNIVKLKSNYLHRSKNFIDSHAQNSLERSIASNNLMGSNEILCMVTDTNYNTHRGKYLRAIRHQKKQQETFAKQTIYFIYILLFITVVIYIILINRVHASMSSFGRIIYFLDLLFTCIPPTLPTVMSVGINFAQLRLSKYGIHSVLPESILTGGRVDTIVLEGQQALGKDYEVQNVVVGVKNDRGLGYVFTSYNEFANFDKQVTMNNRTILKNAISQPQNNAGKNKINNEMVRTGEMFFNALASCHTLEMYEGNIEGQKEEKQLFEFTQSIYVDEDKFEIGSYEITVNKRIYFRTKDRKMAVTATVDGSQKFCGPVPKSNNYTDQNFSLMDEIHEESQLEIQRLNSESGPRKVIFMKGPPEKILAVCRTETYPSNAFDYIVDMAEKGFLLYAYAYKEYAYTQQIGSQKEIVESFKTDFSFLGYAVLKQKKHPDAEETILALKKANLNLLLVSEERQLETNALAILNNLYTKNQLILCSLNKEKDQIFCKGHVEWESEKGEFAIDDFITNLNSFAQKSNLSLTSPLYQELFIRRDQKQINQMFFKCKIFSRMLHRHERNLYYQLQKRNKVSFAVGGGGSLSQCANLSLELQRDHSSLLSSFHTKEDSLKTVINCLRICRAGLSTNFHCFSMMILFSLTQFTTMSILHYNYQVITDSQMLYEDLFITFPIFVTLNMTQPSSNLSKQRPLGSFFAARSLLTMIGQTLIQLIAQFALITYLMSLEYFQSERDQSANEFMKNGVFQEHTITSSCLFILSNYIYLGVVLSCSVSRPFRKPFYTNPYYTVNLILLWLYNTLIVLAPSITSNQMRLKKGLNKQQQETLVLAMIFGNLVMLLMYMYQNLLVWLFNLIGDRQFSLRDLLTRKNIQLIDT